MKCKQCGKPAGFFKTECGKCKEKGLIIKEIENGTSVIRKDQKLSKVDAEYLAIVNYIDSLETNSDNEKIIMDMLTGEYGIHHSDIMVHLAVKSGVTKITPGAEKVLTVRHNKRKPLIFEKKPAPKRNKEWKVDGKLHRTNGPARILPNDVEEWYLNGKLHREDGPAIVYNNGEEEWYLYGKRHREGGPAERRTNGDAWYLNGVRHRLGGPAVEFSNGSLKWFINGKQYSQKDFEELMEKR